MKTAWLISIAAFAVACDGSHQPRTDSPPNATGAGSDGAKPPAARASTSSNRAITVVGCLQGPSVPRPTGTSQTAGDRSGAPAAGIDAAEKQKHGAARTGPFVLSNAAVESRDASGSRAADAGAAVSAGSSFELDGLPADAQESVNKRVRITGRLDLGAATSEAATPGAAAAVPSTTGATSTRDDVRANSTGVAGDSTNRRLTVETVEVVAQQCAPQ